MHAHTHTHTHTHTHRCTHTHTHTRTHTHTHTRTYLASVAAYNCVNTHYTHSNYSQRNSLPPHNRLLPEETEFDGGGSGPDVA